MKSNYVTEMLQFFYKFDKPIAEHKQVMYNKSVKIIDIGGRHAKE